MLALLVTVGCAGGNALGRSSLALGGRTRSAEVALGKTLFFDTRLSSNDRSIAVFERFGHAFGTGMSAKSRSCFIPFTRSVTMTGTFRSRNYPVIEGFSVRQDRWTTSAPG